MVPVHPFPPVLIVASASANKLPGKPNWYVWFRFGGVLYKKSLGIPIGQGKEAVANEKRAHGEAERIASLLRELDTGRHELAQTDDVWEFLKSNGKRKNKLEAPTDATLQTLFDEYLANLPEDHKRPTTQKTERIHRNHLLRELRPTAKLREIQQEKIQAYIKVRQEKGHKGIKAGSRTVRKELETLRMIWLSSRYSSLMPEFDFGKRLKLNTEKAKAPFSEYSEIKSQTVSGKVTKEKAAWLFKSVYLLKDDVRELLNLVEKTPYPGKPYWYSLIALCSHTGIRRSELANLRKTDYLPDSDEIRVPENKRVKGKETYRYVPLTSRARRALEDWLSNHPGNSEYLFCDEQGSQILLDKVWRRYFQKLTKYAELPGFHCLRHSIGSILAIQGESDAMIRGILGHETEEMMEHYRHISKGAKKNALKEIFD